MRDELQRLGLGRTNPELMLRLKLRYCRNMMQEIASCALSSPAITASWAASCMAAFAGHELLALDLPETTSPIRA